MKAAVKTQALIQIPFRCEPDLHVRIIRALGSVMTRSGKKLSKNDFVIQLIEAGLKNLEQGKS